jgi:hypothetical protein
MLLHCEGLEQPMSQMGHQLPLGANAERVRCDPISGPCLKLIDCPKGARSCREQVQQNYATVVRLLA